MDVHGRSDTSATDRRYAADACVIYPTRLCPRSRTAMDSGLLDFASQHPPCAWSLARPASRRRARLAQSLPRRTADAAARSRRRHRDAQRASAPSTCPLAIDTVDARPDPATASRRSTCRSRCRASRASVDPEPRNYAQDLQLSARAASARARRSASAACACTRTTFRRRCPTARGRPAASACSRRSASKCCADRFRRCTAMRPAASSRCSPRTGPRRPSPSGQVIGGSYGTWNAIAKAAGQAGAVNYVVAGNYFDDRRLSRPQRGVARPRQRQAHVRRDARHAITIIGNSLVPARDAGSARPDARAVGSQSAPGRSGGDAVRHAQDGQPAQGGATRRAASCRRRTDAARDRLRRAADRSASTSRCPGIGATSSGGVTDLDRNFGGVDARLDRALRARRPARLRHVGADYEIAATSSGAATSTTTATLGDCAATRIDTREQHRRLSADSNCSPLDPISLLAGVPLQRRALRLGRPLHPNARIRTTAGSAATATRARSPACVWHATDTLNVYASYGQGFETPTFTELAYRPVGLGPQSRAASRRSATRPRSG